MAIGGVVGAVRGTPGAGWFWLLPGVGLQLFILLVPATVMFLWQNASIVGMILNRAAVALVGLLLGVVTLGPNVMMGDPGTPLAQTMAGVGCLASILMGLGGIVGAVVGTPGAGWFWLLPGVGFQLLMFLPGLLDGLWRMCCRRPDDYDVDLWQMCHRRWLQRQQPAATPLPQVSVSPTYVIIS
jgi:hypothetical protein